ncbi:sugar ABC transporter permease [Eubacteriales bacterium OttesenSCG-928-K08]|nr:sugar ABC transporter permease [Eubacteriales bacterium OttesenSCG-928-K08]
MQPTQKSKRRFVPYKLISPAFLVVFTLSAYCLFWLISISMSSWRFGAPIESAAFVGLGNYKWLLFSKDSLFWVSLKTTTIYTLGTVTAQLLLGLLIALLFNRIRYGRALYTALLLIPMVLMPSMVGLVARMYFYDKGLVNYFVELIAGMRVNWASTNYALISAMLVDIWEYTPFFIVILSAGMQALPQDVYEAARMDGSGGAHLFFCITLPLLRPLIITALVLRLMESLRIFDVIYTMYAGGPGTATTTLPLLIYRQTMVAHNAGTGSAISILLILIIFVLSLVLMFMFERARKTLSEGEGQ